MGKFSKIFHHIELKDLRNKNEEKKHAKIEEEKKKEEFKKYISTEMVDKQSNWRDQVSLDVNLIEQESPRSIIKDIKKIVKEGMTTSDIATLSIEKSDTPVASLDASIEASFQPADNYVFVGDTSGQNAFVGTRIRASGSGSGNSGGFNVGGNYLAFDQAGSGASGGRHAILAPIDASEIDTITITAIVGDDSNGGSPPNNPSQVGNENLGVFYHHTDMRFHQGIGFLPPTPGNPDDGRPPGFSIAQSLAAGDIISVGGSKGSGLHQYSLAIPEYARSKATQFSLVMANSSGTFDNIGITDIKFERRAPMNVVVTLDDPKASSFIRGAEQGSTPQSRKKRVRGILKSSDKYSNKYLGKDFPGTGSDLSDTSFPDKEIEQMQQQNRDETKDHIGDQFTDNQIVDILNKLGDPPEEVSSDPKDYDMTGLSPQAIKLGHWDPRYPLNMESGYYARLQVAKDALSSAMQSAFYQSLVTGDSPDYNTPLIKQTNAAKKQAEKELEGWQTFKANNNWKYIGPDIGAEPEPVENEMTDAEREKIIAELDKDIAKYSAEEQAAYDEMKRIALEYGMDVIQVISGLFSGGTTYAVPTLGKLGLKLLRKLGKNKLGKLVRKTLRKMKSKKKKDDDVDLQIDDKDSNPKQGQSYENLSREGEARYDEAFRRLENSRSKGGKEGNAAGKLLDELSDAQEIGDAAVDAVINKAKNNKDVGYLFKNEISNMPKPKPKSDFNKPQGTMGQGTDPGAGYGSMMQSNKLEGPTLLERLRSKGFFNPDDIKPTFPENPPPELDPVTQMHPKYGKRSARYKKLDPASANAMPSTGDPETDAIVDKQRTKSKPKDYSKMFNKIKKIRNKY